MASSSKKRKDPSQSRTIVDFFSNNSSTKKSKFQNPPPKTNKKDFKATLSREVIIIDSDSDDGTTKRDKGKTRVIPCAKQHTSPEGEKGNLRCSNECEWKPSLTRVALSNHKELQDDELPSSGKPSALLQVPVQNTVEWKETLLQSSVIEATSSSSVFGVPTLLLRSSVEPAHELLFERKVSAEVGVPTPYSDPGNIPHSIDVIDVNFTGDGEQWGVGDDELAILEAANDDIEMEDVSEQLNDCVHPASCPICELDISRLLGLVGDMTTLQM
jgi:hypothetical protein